MLLVNKLSNFQPLRLGLLREFWEHKRLFWYLPWLCAGLIFLAGIYIAVKAPDVSFFKEDGFSISIGSDEPEETIEMLTWGDAKQEPLTSELASRFENYEFVKSQQALGEYDHGEFAENAGSLLPKLFLGLGFVIAGYYLLSALFSDRRNNSILFWKSLPVSEYFNVGLKLGVGIAIIPLLYLVVGCFVVLMLKILFGVVAHWASPHSDIVLWAREIDVLDTVAMSVWYWCQCLVWCLPLAMLFLLVSAFSKRAPAIYLFVLFLSVAFVEYLFFDKVLLTGWFLAHNPFVVLMENAAFLWVFEPIGSLWVDLLLGLIVATALYFPTVWLRNHRFEV